MPVAPQKPLKRQLPRVIEGILAEVRAEKLAPGARIPAERVLAHTWGVSYMTARSAVSVLADQGLLVTRDRVGTFVPRDIKLRLELPAINVITRPGQGAIERQFIRELTRQADGMRCWLNIVEITERTQDQALRMLRDTARPAVVLMNPFLRDNSEIAQAMQAHPKAVLVGANLSSIGIRSVLCDDAAAAWSATTLLGRLGHERIGLLHQVPADPVTTQIVGGWRSYFNAMNDATLRACLLTCEHADNGGLNEAMDRCVTRALANGTWAFTAVVAADMGLGLALLHAVTALGFHVPRELSIIALGVSEDRLHYSPQLSVVDPRLDLQVEYALDSALRLARGETIDRLHLVHPEMLPGETVSPPVGKTENAEARETGPARRPDSWNGF